MASKFMKSAAKGVGKRGLDLPMAALAALSAGFVIFSLPADLLEQLVAATGAGNIVAAAQPPLGNTARVGLSAAGAAAAFALVYLLLRLIDGRPAERQPEDVEEEPVTPRRRLIVESALEQEEQPVGLRLRRSDAHPDAPARRPIFAMTDLGEPEPDKSPLLSKPERKAKAPAAPFWEPEDFPAAEPEEAEAWMLQQEEQDRQPQERSPAEPQSPEPEAVAEAAQAPQQQAPQHEPEPASEATEAPQPEPAAQPVPETVAATREPIRQNESISDLMARLERGLSRRQEQNGVEPQVPEQSPQAFASPGEERLKSAIDHLQRIAARGH